MMSNTTGIVTDPSQLVNADYHNKTAPESTQPVSGLIEAVAERAERLGHKLNSLHDRLEGPEPDPSELAEVAESIAGYRNQLKLVIEHLSFAEQRLDEILAIME